MTTGPYPADHGAVRVPASTGAAPDPDDVSIGQLIGDISDDPSKLFRQEVELAKAEVKQEASKAGKAAGMLGGAGFAGYLTVLLLSFALAFALGNVMDLGWAFLIVAVMWGIAHMGHRRGRFCTPTAARNCAPSTRFPARPWGLSRRVPDG